MFFCLRGERAAQSACGSLPSACGQRAFERVFLWSPWTTGARGQPYRAGGAAPRRDAHCPPETQELGPFQGGGRSPNGLRHFAGRANGKRAPRLAVSAGIGIVELPTATVDPDTRA